MCGLRQTHAAFLFHYILSNDASVANKHPADDAILQIGAFASHVAKQLVFQGKPGEAADLWNVEVCLDWSCHAFERLLVLLKNVCNGAWDVFLFPSAFPGVKI